MSQRHEDRLIWGQMGFIDGEKCCAQRQIVEPRLARREGIPHEIYHRPEMSLCSQADGRCYVYGMLMMDYRWAPAGKWGMGSGEAGDENVCSVNRMKW